LGLNELIPPEEEEIEQSESLVEEPAGQTEVGIEEAPIEAETQLMILDNPLPPLAIRQERQKVLLNCPKSTEDTNSLSFLEGGEIGLEENGSGEEQSLLDGTIDINSDITTNQIWTADNVYHITASINVQAFLVIEPGTMITFAYGAKMSVNNGGALISSGTPDNPIIYTCDLIYPDWGTYFLTTYFYYGYYYYICPIFIEETASPATTVTYNFIEGALVGIATLNITLDHPVENNILFGNYYGIGEYGTKFTDIKNNLCAVSNYGGIEIYMGDVNGTGDANSIINISNNTCDFWQLYGIIVHGVENRDEAGLAIISNNIVSEAYYSGLDMIDGYMSIIVSNTGYFANGSNKNFDFNEYYPIIETEMPYVSGEEFLAVYYLRQDCNFIDAGSEYIEQTRLIGKTTDINEFPDSGNTDLGFHYPNWNFSNPGSGDSLSADLDDSLIVDFNDFAVLADYWQQSTSSDADLDDSGFVDYGDLAILADQWLKNADPNIQIQISGDPNTGYVNVDLTGYTSDTIRIFLLANGQIIGGTFRFKDDESITIDTSKYGNEEQQFKVISVDSNSHITCSNITSVVFSKPLNYCVLPKIYEKNRPLPFAAYNTGAGDITVKAYANGGNLVWSQTYSGNSIFDFIPASITNQYEFDYVSFDNDSGQSLAKKVTDPNLPNFSENVQALIVLPKWWIRLLDYQIVWAVQNAFKYHGIIYATLSGSNASYEKVMLYARNKHIKYLYIGCTDGHYLLNDKAADDPDNRRTNFDLYDPYGGDESFIEVVSIQRDDYSDPNMAPPWCCDLWYSGINSVASMGFSYLEFAYFDFCYSGRLKINASNQLVQGQPGQQGIFDIPHSDMSFALGMAGSGRSNFYQGWYDKALSGPFPPPINETEYQRWSRIEWYQLEDGMNLYEALDYVISQQTHFDVNDPVNCYRLKGEGYLEDIELRNW
jgi:hypothetical protein